MLDRGAAMLDGDTAMLELTDVVKDYRVGGQTVRALDRVGLRIEAGEFTAIVGPSGSGKSTLLHLLGALDCPDSGSIRFRGEEIADLDDDRQSEFRRHRVGFVFQFFNLLPTLSAWENVAVPKLLDGTGLRRARPRALELLDLVGLADRANHRPSELSGGQMQRVAVARALIMDPPLILADEPTGNLDSATGAAILELLGGIAARGNSVVMVTHDMSAVDHCDRVITLRDGRIGTVEHTPRAASDPRTPPPPRSPGGPTAVGAPPDAATSTTAATFTDAATSTDAGTPAGASTTPDTDTPASISPPSEVVAPEDDPALNGTRGAELRS
jgi:putative ABC transport system ATP-binding protein